MNCTGFSSSITVQKVNLLDALYPESAVAVKDVCRVDAHIK